MYNFNMNTNWINIKDKVKSIIFDFDETLYYSSNIKEKYVDYILNTILALSKLDKKEALLMMKNLGFTSSGEKRIGFGKNCELFGISKEQWNGYRIKNFFQIDYDNAEIVDNFLLKELSKNYNLYIVSNEIYENLLFKAKQMGIELSYIKCIFSPKAFEALTYNQTKKDVYKRIIEAECCSPNEIIVLGDRFSVDLEPMEELGGYTKLIKHPRDIKAYFKGE